MTDLIWRHVRMERCAAAETIEPRRGLEAALGDKAQGRGLSRRTGEIARQSGLPVAYHDIAGAGIEPVPWVASRDFAIKETIRETGTMTLAQFHAHPRCGRIASHQELLTSEDEQEGRHALSDAEKRGPAGTGR